MRKNLEEFDEEEARKERLRRAEVKKNTIKRKHTQSRIDQMMTELSKEGAEEWRKIESEEEKLERLEMKEMKENLWRSTKNLKNKISERKS